VIDGHEDHCDARDTSIEWIRLPRAVIQVGYVAGHLSRRFGCDGELQWIYVIPERRRTHVATELVRLLARWFLDQGARRICVDVGGEEARWFYERHGAVPLKPHWMMWNDIGEVLC
jgi:GNAT superfamily N-acetyltransferase